MKNKFNLILHASLFLIFISALNLSGQKSKKTHDYIGTKACQMCHKKEKDGAQFDVWKASKHSKAYEALLTEEANKLAQEKYGKKAIESEGCLKCHASGYDVAAERLGKKFLIKDGVQCETCHGPGSDYKKLKIMKDRAKSVEMGLIIFKDEAEIEKMCRGCHNEESPTYKEFKFKEMWQKISHYKPSNK